MTSRWRAAVAVTLGVVAIGATGIAALAFGAEPELDGQVSPATTAAAVNTEPTPRVSTPAASTATSTSSSTSTSTTTPATTTTIVPIVTYSADIGALTPVPVVAPIRVTLPDLSVAGPVTPTGVDAAGELAIPQDARTLVWYRFGPTPGAAGSAVIAGHLNWRGVEGIFADLAAIPVGSTFTVDYDDGSQRAFVVRTVELVDKPAVAVNGVFARDGESVLRLITCGGEFDSSTRHYRSNVIVTAVPA